MKTCEGCLRTYAPLEKWKHEGCLKNSVEKNGVNALDGHRAYMRAYMARYRARKKA